MESASEHKFGKAVSLLQEFSVQEFKRFRGWLAWDLGDHSSRLLAFVDAAVETQSQNELFSRLFPGEGFVRKKLANLNTELFGKLKEYLALEEARKDEAHMELGFLKALNNRNLDSFTESAFNQARETIEELDLSYADQCRFAYDVEELFLYNQSKIGINGKHRQIQPLLYEYFTKEWLAKYLLQLLANDNHAKVTNTTHLPRWEPLSLADIEKSPWIQDPGLQSWLQVARNLLNPDAPTLESLEWIENLSLSQTDLQHIYLLMINQRIRQFGQKGGEKELQALISFYQELMDRGELRINGKIRPQAYRHLVTYYRYLIDHWRLNDEPVEEKIPTVLEALDQYCRELPLNAREELSVYTKWVMIFCTQQYEEFEKEKNEYRFRDTYLRLHFRIMKVQYLYDEKSSNLNRDLNSLNKHMESLEGVSQKTKAEWLTRLSLLKSLKNAKQLDDLIPIKQQLEAGGRFNDRAWFQRRIKLTEADLRK